MTAQERLPVTLLTGFLGSGKTTLLQKVLADPRMARTAVIINEMGEVGIDHLLVGKLDDDTMLLKSGCLCCGLKTDFTDSLLSLYHRRQTGQYPSFDRVIVETTGMADPVPLLRLLMTHEPINSWYSVRGVVTTLDTLLPLDPKSARVERQRQISLADHIVLTKTDLASRDQVQSVQAAAQGLNSRANYVVGGDEDAVMRALLQEDRYPVVRNLYRGPQERVSVLGRTPSEVSHSRVGSFCLYADGPLPWSGLVSFFQFLARTYGGRLLRLKGLLSVADSARPVVVHGVEHFLFPETYLDEWPDTDQRSRIVLIGEDLDQEDIEELFELYVLRGSRITAPKVAAG
ncbi:GTP-binding protein [Pseudomonas sp. LABIM340]|uniref:CobW family GTP-binding protein n=1 Tax=Pseudomonas sp. LABIM340 TaxID=3156585 RepID=UPI0032AF6F42